MLFSLWLHRLKKYVFREWQCSRSVSVEPSFYSFKPFPKNGRGKSERQGGAPVGGCLLISKQVPHTYWAMQLLFKNKVHGDVSAIFWNSAHLRFPGERCFITCENGVEEGAAAGAASRRRAEGENIGGSGLVSGNSRNIFFSPEGHSHALSF